MIRFSAIALGWAFALHGAAHSQATQIVPDTPRIVVVESFHGSEVDDPYRWLEEVSSQAQNWAAAQNEAAESFAGPGVAAREARILALSQHTITRRLWGVGESLVFLRGWSGVTYQGLYVGDPNGDARHLDGASIEDGVVEESTTSYWPSPEGRLVASLSHPVGSNWGELRLIKIASGEIIARRQDVHASVSNGAWLPDGSAFAYSAYDRSSDTPVRPHVNLLATNGDLRTLPTPGAEDANIFTIRAAQDTPRLFVEATRGTSGNSEVYLQHPNDPSSFRRIAGGDGTWIVLGGRGDSAWMYTNSGAPNGRVVRLDDLQGRVQQREIVAEGVGSIAGASQVGGNALGMFGRRVALLYQEDDGPVVRVFDLNGRRATSIEIPPTGAIWGGFSGDPQRDELYYDFLGVAEPSSVYHVNLRTGGKRLVSAGALSVSPDDFVARRIVVERSDGARVPVIIAHRRGLDTSRPRRTIMYGYGAFGWVSFLWYQPQIVDWMLSDDGVFVVAGVRGGGERGSAWREAGRRLNRQTAIDDYVAVAEALIASGITTSEQLVANGSSIAGGLVGAAANQRPDLFGAVSLDYAALDLLRYQRFGHAHLWSEELGTPEDAVDFRNLLRISPYHTIPGDRCPPTLVRVGPNDATVTPAHGYKYTAALQHACGQTPIFMDLMEGAAHNYGSTPEEAAHSHAVALEYLRRVLD